MDLLNEGYEVDRSKGINIYFVDAQKKGFNSVKNEKVIAQRRELFVDYEITLDEDYWEVIE